MKRLPIVVSTLVLSLALAGQGFVEGPVYIESKLSGKVLTVDYNLPEMDGYGIVQMSYEGSDFQTFELDYKQNCTYTIKQINSYYLLDYNMFNKNLFAGTSYSGVSEMISPQDFIFLDAGYGYFYIVSVLEAGKVLTLENWSGQDGTRICLQPLYYSESQKFKVVPVRDREDDDNEGTFAGKVTGYYSGDNLGCCDLVVILQDTNDPSNKREVRCTRACNFLVKNVKSGYYEVVVELRAKIDGIFQPRPSSVRIDRGDFKKVDLDLDVH